MSEENSNIHTLLRVQDCDLKRGRAQMLTPQGRMSNLAKDSRKKKEDNNEQMSALWAR